MMYPTSTLVSCLFCSHPAPFVSAPTTRSGRGATGTRRGSAAPPDRRGGGVKLISVAGLGGIGSWVRFALFLVKFLVREREERS